MDPTAAPSGENTHQQQQQHQRNSTLPRLDLDNYVGTYNQVLDRVDFDLILSSQSYGIQANDDDDNEHYRGPIYGGNTALVGVLHSSIPRYGSGGRDVVVLARGADDEKLWYKMGVYSQAILSWCVYVIWAGWLLYRKRQGVGWCSGVPPKLPRLPTELDGAVEVEDEAADAKAEADEQSTNAVDEGEASEANTLSPSDDGEFAEEKENESGSRAYACTASVKWLIREQANETTSSPLNKVSNGKMNARDLSKLKHNIHSAAPSEELLSPNAVSPYDDLHEGDVPRGKIDAADDGTLLDLQVVASVDPAFLAREVRDRPIVQWANDYNRIKVGYRRTRITVLVCGAIIILLSIPLLFKGFAVVHRTIVSAAINLPALHSIFESVLNGTEYLHVETSHLRNDRDEFLSSLTGWCPNAVEANITANEWNKLFLNMTTHLNSVLNNTQLIDLDALSTVEKVLFEATTVLGGVSHGMTVASSLWHYVCIALLILLDGIVVIFMVGIRLAWKGRRQPEWFSIAQTYWALPIFVFLLIVCVAASTLGLIYGVYMSDFCIGSPDDQLLRLISAPFPIDNYADYMVTGCDPSKKPRFLLFLFQATYAALRYTTAFVTFLSSWDPWIISDLCGRDTNAILSSGQYLERILTIVLNLIDGLDGLVKCERLNSVYAPLAYETVCDHGVEASMYLFTHLFPIWICGMVIVTFRIAWQYVDVERDQENKKETGEAELTRSGDAVLFSSRNLAEEEHIIKIHRNTK